MINGLLVIIFLLFSATAGSLVDIWEIGDRNLSWTIGMVFGILIGTFCEKKTIKSKEKKHDTTTRNKRSD